MPVGKVITQPEQLDKARLTFDSTAVKVQVLKGQRGKAGGVKLCHGLAGTKAAAAALLGREFQGEVVRKVLVEQYVGVEKEHYLAITYDQVSRSPALLTRYKGGRGVEAGAGVALAKGAINPALGFSLFAARQALYGAGFAATEVAALAPLAQKLWQVFVKYDCRLAEINPLVRVQDGRYLADDAKVIIDEAALFRQPIFNKRAASVTSRPLSKREKAARTINQKDHRGTAGASYLDLDGNVAILASGGGGALTALDEFTKAASGTAFKPANFTEYSGNPPAEKVVALTKIVLSKPELKGCWVVGGVANFTDIYETLSGFLAGLRAVKPKPRYPIVIRRGGPRTEEAFEMLRKAGDKEGYRFILHDPGMSFYESAKALISEMTKSE